MTAQALLIENARLIDPSVGLDRVGRLLLIDGHFSAIDPSDGELPADVARLDAQGLIVCPGLVDIGTELGEPGREEDETIESALNAALAGGFTSVVCSANTLPPIDSAASVQFVQQRALRCDSARVHVLGCVSKERRGEELAEIGSLTEAGAVGFSDMPAAIESTALLKSALEYCLMFDRPIIEPPELVSLSGNGVMHQDKTQMLLGLSPLPPEAEDLATSRDLRLVEATGGNLHLSSISTSGSVDICRRVRSREIQFSVGVHVANTHMHDELLRGFDSNLKVNPPLRSAQHIADVQRGLSDGTIDIISSGHRPFALEKKMQELDAAPFGMTALETTLGQVATHLVRPEIIDWSAAIEKLSTAPARLLNLSAGTLKPGQPADFILIDPVMKWQFDVRGSASRSGNTPLHGDEFIGRVVQTFVGGVQKFTL